MGSQKAALNRRLFWLSREPMEYRSFWAPMTLVQVVSGKEFRSIQ